MDSACHGRLTDTSVKKLDVTVITLFQVPRMEIFYHYSLHVDSFVPLHMEALNNPNS